MIVRWYAKYLGRYYFWDKATVLFFIYRPSEYTTRRLRDQYWRGE